MQAGDEILKVASGPEQMTRRRGRRAAVPPRAHAWAAAARAARSPRSARAGRPPSAPCSTETPRSGNAGLTRGEPAAGVAGLPHPDRHRDRPRERLGRLVRLADPDGAPLPGARPGQYLTLRLQPDGRSARCCATTPCPGRPTPATTGSASSANPTARPAAICTPASGSAISSRSPHPAARSSSTASQAPVLLISAGIGATPVLAMLHALAQEHSEREIWWLHGARSGRDHCFAAEARALLASLPNVRTHVCYSRPASTDLEGRDFDSAGRLSAALLAELDPPRDAEAYLCGPIPFMDEISAALAAAGLDASRIHTEPFGPAPGHDAGHRVSPARRRIRRPASPATARRSSSPAATSPSAGATTTPASSSSPRLATCRSAGRAAPASATPARRRSSPARSATAQTRSNPPRTAAHSSAARSHPATWSSTSEPDRLARHGSDLLHQAQDVRDAPVLGDLPVAETDDVDRLELDRATGRGDPHELAAVSPAEDRPGRL